MLSSVLLIAAGLLACRLAAGRNDDSNHLRYPLLITIGMACTPAW